MSEKSLRLSEIILNEATQNNPVQNSSLSSSEVTVRALVEITSPPLCESIVHNPSEVPSLPLNQVTNKGPIGSTSPLLSDVTVKNAAKITSQPLSDVTLKNQLEISTPLSDVTVKNLAAISGTDLSGVANKKSGNSNPHLSKVTRGNDATPIPESIQIEQIYLVVGPVERQPATRTKYENLLVIFRYCRMFITRLVKDLIQTAMCHLYSDRVLPRHILDLLSEQKRMHRDRTASFNRYNIIINRTSSMTTTVERSPHYALPIASENTVASSTHN